MWENKSRLLLGNKRVPFLGRQKESKKEDTKRRERGTRAWRKKKDKGESQTDWLKKHKKKFEAGRKGRHSNNFSSGGKKRGTMEGPGGSQRENRTTRFQPQGGIIARGNVSTYRGQGDRRAKKNVIRVT